MRKFLILSILVFLLVFTVESLGFEYQGRNAGDHPYYILGGRGWFGDGHDFTLLLSKPLSLLGDPALPIFFNFFFVLSIYFLIKPFVKYPEFAFIFGPVMPLTSLYAQIFAVGLFNFMLGFYFRGYKKLPALVFFLIFLAHYWSGLIIFGLLVLFFFIHKPKSTFLPVAIWTITLSFVLIMPQQLNFLVTTPTDLPSPFTTLADWAGPGAVFGFFFLFSRGLSFFFFGYLSLIFLSSRDKEFFTISAVLFFVPLIVAYIFKSQVYWASRLFYYMPLLALFSILMSLLYEADK